MTIRDARPEDAPFLAQCLLAGMHFFDFETEVPQNEALYRRLIDCEQREDLLYSYKYTRMAEMDGRPAGALLSYPGELYRPLKVNNSCSNDLESVKKEDFLWRIVRNLAKIFF